MLALRFYTGIFCFAMMVCGTASVSAQGYPDKPIRIVTSEVGGGTDFAARLIALCLTGGLGQQVIVDNRPSGVIPAQIVAKAAPDGHTLLVAATAFWLLPLMQNLSYDPVREFSPISLMTRSPSVLVVHPAVAAKSVKELIALARASPGELNYASGPTGVSNHLAAELFKAMAGVNLVRIPYKGGGPAVNALIAGEVQVSFPSAAGVTQHIRSGRLRALAITSAQPSVLFPELPTLAASGLAGYESEGLAGVFAPAKTPAVLINRLNQEIVRCLDRTDVREKFLKAGLETVGSSPQEFGAKIKSEITRLGKVIKDAGIRSE